MSGATEKKIYHILSVALLISIGLFAFANGDAQSLWVDELSTIGFVRHGLTIGQSMHYFLSTEYDLPLYCFIMYFWYRIVPFGEQWVSLPSIIAGLVCFGFVEKITTENKGRKAGLAALFICCGSSGIIYQTFWEVRSYGLTIGLSAAALWAFLRVQREKSTKTLIVFGILQFFSLWTHWYSMFPIFFMGLTILILVIARKNSWKYLLPFVIDGITFVPWLIHGFINQSEVEGIYWYEVPTIKNLIWTIWGLCNSRMLYKAGFMLGCISITTSAIILFLQKKGVGSHLSGAEKGDSCEWIYTTTYCLMSLLVGLVLVYLYCAVINPSQSVFQFKYFLVYFPYVVVVIALGFAWIIELITERYRNWAWLCIAVVLFGHMLWGYTDAYLSINKTFEDFRQAALDMSQDSQFQSETSALMTANVFCVLDGFTDFYLDGQEIEKPNLIFSTTDRAPEEKLFYPSYHEVGLETIGQYNRIYYLVPHSYMEDELQEFIDHNYSISEPDSTDVYLVYVKEN